MPDDELMDRLLKDTMAGDAPPELSPAFDARVMRRIHPPRLSMGGRVIIAVYAVVAVSAAAWFLRDLPMLSIVAAFAISASVAAGASAYGRRISAHP